MARTVVDAADRVHSAPGPVLLESVYEVCLAHEIRQRRLKVDRQVSLPVKYDGMEVDAGLRLGLLVENSIVGEVKAVEESLPVHSAQAFTYLRLSGCRLDLLVNFNVPLIKSGIKRIAL